jgi:hypothetical protein
MTPPGLSRSRRVAFLRCRDEVVERDAVDVRERQKQLQGGPPPTWLAALGMVGYATHLVGAAAELFGFHISLVLLVSGAIFELALAAWLLTKGFTAPAYAPPSLPATPTAARQR